MLSHAAIWDGIDTMARRHGLSVSALARLAGLDSTTFNLSKRRGKDGRERWPSTESIAKILEATGDTFESFLAGTGAYMQPPNPLDMTIPTPRSVPLLGFAQAGAGGFFDSAGFPAGQGWDEVRLPTAGEDGTYALEVTGDSMLPLYRDGDVILVSPTAQLRRGDRVVARTREGEVMVKVLHRQTPKLIELHSLNPEHPNRVFQTSEIEWVARIVWASQ
jgi:phage repressor protein C with HTH and peptisase S24 domain